MLSAVALVGVIVYWIQQAEKNNDLSIADSKIVVSSKDEPKTNDKPKVLTSLSLGKSYDSVEALTDAADLVAQINITGIQGILPEQDSTRYNAEVTDVLKGSESKDSIVITQVGIKKDGVDEETETPYFKQGDELVIFLKKGQDPKIDPIYYVAGEYQGKFNIENGKVYAVNPALKNQYIDGQNLSAFKESIRNIIKEQK